MCRMLLTALVVSSSIGPAAAAVVEVTVHNCTSLVMDVFTYDEGDMVKMIPNKQYKFPPFSSGPVQCNGQSRCKIDVLFGHNVAYYETGGSLHIRFHWAVGIYSVSSCDIR